MTNSLNPAVRCAEAVGSIAHRSTGVGLGPRTGWQVGGMGTEGELVHVHNEPNWPVAELRRRGETRPLILNVHDIASARPFNAEDSNKLLEAEAYHYADGLIFISERQRDFARACGFDTNKPTAILPNYASHSTIVAKKLLPHIGGVCYAGGLDPRGAANSWRDLSPIADVLHGELHIYPGMPSINYGIVHRQVFDYRLLMHRIAQHDWNFSGTPVPNPAWDMSYPNKVFEGFAAGVPLIALNNPLLAEFCDAGLGIYCDTLADVARAAKAKPNKFRKRVLEERERFTMRYNIQPVLDLYEEVLDAHRGDKQLQPVGLPQACDRVGSARDAIGIRL